MILLSQLKITDSHDNFDMSTSNESVNLSAPQTKKSVLDKSQNTYFICWRSEERKLVQRE